MNFESCKQIEKEVPELIVCVKSSHIYNFKAKLERVKPEYISKTEVRYMNFVRGKLEME